MCEGLNRWGVREVINLQRQDQWVLTGNGKVKAKRQYAVLNSVEGREEKAEGRGSAC